MVYCTVTNDLNQDRRMRRIGDILVSNGWPFTIIGRKKKGGLPLNDAPYAQERLSCLFQKGPFFYFEFNLRLLIHLIKNRPKIVYSVDLDTLSAGVIYKNLFGARLIFDAHEYFEEVPELIGRPFIRWIWKKIGKWGIPQADLAITVGHALAAELKRQYRVEFKVIRNTRNCPDASPIVKKLSFPFRLIYIGMYNPGRGLEELIEAMTHLENCELCLAGSGPLEKHLKDLALKKKVGQRVIFNAFLTGQKIDEFLASGHLGCNLLNPISKSYAYSLANKTFDYMHYGLPSLHIRLPEYEAIHQNFNCFVLLENLSVSSIVKVVKAIMKDENRYHLLSENNLKARDHYSWQTESGRLIEAMSGLVLPETTSI